MTDQAFTADPMPASTTACAKSHPVASTTARLRITLHRVEIGRWPDKAKRLKLKIASFVVIDTTDDAIGRELISSQLVMLLDGADRDHLLRALEPPMAVRL